MNCPLLLQVAETINFHNTSRKVDNEPKVLIETKQSTGNTGVCKGYMNAIKSESHLGRTILFNEIFNCMAI